MSSTLKYRADIDGLRAIAVTSVVLFHARLPWLGGGFTGVDIFFVISGFLITGLLAAEHTETGRINLADFYARRIRRLLPALLVVVLVTMVLGLALLSPAGELQALVKSALAALFFVSNLFFFRQPAGYFAPAADAFPLLHTWTLAVEEQFYIVWPLLLPLLAWAAGRAGMARDRALVIGFALIGVVSFALCLFVLGWRPMGAFYLTPFRAWEFAIGALLAILLPHWHGTSRWLGLGASSTGLIAIIAGFALIDSGQPFPGLMALLPVMGAAAVLAGGGLWSTSPVSRLLSTGPMVYVGKVSYGWYLWHWPLLAFASFYAEGSPSHGLTVAVLAIAFMASSVSYHVLEAPIRAQRIHVFRATKQTLRTGCGALLVAGVVALGVYWRAEVVLAATPQLQRVAQANSTAIDWPVECQNFRVPYPGLEPASACLLGKVDATQGLMLWGDSHAHHLIPLLEDWAKANQFRFLPRTKGGCRPFGGEFLTVGIALSPPNLRDCGGFNTDVRAEIADAREAGMTSIVIASRWPHGLDDEAHALMATPDLWSTELKDTVAFARSKGLRVVLPVDVPAFEKAVPQCLTRHTDATCRADKDAFQRRRAEFISVIGPMAANDHGIRILDLTANYCPHGQCEAVYRDVVRFKDRHHLSVMGSRSVGRDAVDALNQALLP